jgi:hypothetical protein
VQIAAIVGRDLTPIGYNGCRRSRDPADDRIAYRSRGHAYRALTRSRLLPARSRAIAAHGSRALRDRDRTCYTRSWVANEARACDVAAAARAMIASAMAGRLHALGAVLATAGISTLAFSAGFAAVGFALNALSAFAPAAPNPKFSDEQIFELNNVVLLLVLGAATSAFLISAAITAALAARRPLLRGCAIAAASGASCAVVSALLFALCAPESIPALLAACGAASGVISVQRRDPR